MEVEIDAYHGVHFAFIRQGEIVFSPASIAQGVKAGSGEGRGEYYEMLREMARQEV